MRPSRTALSVVAAAGAAALGGALVALPASANGEGGHHHFRTIHGTVVSDDGTTLVLTNRSGTHDILVNGDTKYSETGDPNPVTTATPGQFVAVKIIDFVAPPGSNTSSSSSSTSSTSSTTSSTDGTGPSPDSSPSSSPASEPVAGRVTILLQSISGVVTNITGTTVTLTRDEDSTKTVDVSSADIYQRTRAADGTWTTTPATLAVNDLVTAFGTNDKTTPTTLDAQFVRVRGMATADDNNESAATSSTSSTSPTSSTTTTTEDSSGLKPAVTSSTIGEHDQSATDDHDSDADSTAPSATWVKGTVVSAANNSIVIKKFDGSQVTVTTTDATKYRTNSNDWSGSSGSSAAPASFSGIAPNDKIAAEVTPSGGALDASVVYYAAPQTRSGDDHSGSGSWSGDHSSSSPSGTSGSYGDHDGGSGGSYGGDGSYGGGQSSRH